MLSGFAEIDLVQNDKGKQYALKRQLCFSEEEKRITLREVEFYDQFDHVNIVQCVGYTVNEGGKRVKAAKKRTVIGKVELECEVCILFPFYRVSSASHRLVISRGSLYLVCFQFQAWFAAKRRRVDEIGERELE